MNKILLGLAVIGISSSVFAYNSINGQCKLNVNNHINTLTCTLASSNFGNFIFQGGGSYTNMDKLSLASSGTFQRLLPISKMGFDYEISTNIDENNPCVFTVDFKQNRETVVQYVSRWTSVCPALLDADGDASLTIQ